MANYVTNHYGCGVSATGPNSRGANGYTASGWERDENGALRRVKKPLFSLDELMKGLVNNG